MHLLLSSCCVDFSVLTIALLTKMTCWGKGGKTHYILLLPKDCFSYPVQYRREAIDLVAYLGSL